MTLQTALSNAVDELNKHGVELPLMLIARLSRQGIVKTYAFYASSIRDFTKKMYDGKIDYSAFVSSMLNLIVSQLRIAWFEGMDANGLTEADMTPEWAAVLNEIINSEQDHVAEFGLAIEQAKRAETPIDPLMSRADMWGNRYNDVVNQAKMLTAETGDKLEWQYGDTDHCETCLSLNGLVAYASEWAASAYHPQQPPNELLDCGGWRCQCKLVPTSKRRTKGIAEILGLSAKSMKHYGPGEHPGTGTSQDVHGGDGFELAILGGRFDDSGYVAKLRKASSLVGLVGGEYRVVPFNGNGTRYATVGTGESRIISIDPTATASSSVGFIAAILKHESLHLDHPDWSESKVREATLDWVNNNNLQILAQERDALSQIDQ